MPIKETEREMRSWADHQGWRMQRRGGRWLMYNRRDDDLGKRHSVKTLAEVKPYLRPTLSRFSLAPPTTIESSTGGPALASQ